MKGWKKNFFDTESSHFSENGAVDGVAGCSQQPLDITAEKIGADAEGSGAAEEDEDEEEDAEQLEGEEERNDELFDGRQIEEAKVEVGNARPKLAEGFYEIEAVRKKRVRKGKLQYLIKWRDWPETANTWEPVENLLSCSDFIDAFEESLLSGKRSNRKRKRKHNITHTQTKKKQQQQQSSPGAATCSVPPVKVKIVEQPLLVPSGDDPSGAVGAKSSEPEQGVHDNGEIPESSVSRKTTEQNDMVLKLSEMRVMPVTNRAPETNSQEAQNPGEDLSNGVVRAGDVSQSVQTVRCTGAKRRKSGSVKRFKQNSSTNVFDDLLDATVRAPNCNTIAAAPEGMQNHQFMGDDWVVKSKPESFEDVYNVTQIVKPVGYQASVSNGAQEVSINFLAKRSDGKEVTVDNKFLKANNPLLLINFYEQHLRYSPSA